MSENFDPLFLWEEAKKNIQAQIGERDYNRWFNIGFIEFSKGTLYLSAQSSFYIDQINTRFPNLLESSIKTQFGKEATLQIKIDENMVVSHQKLSEKPEPKSEKIQKLEEKKTPVSKPQKKQLATILHDEFTFDNYIIGDNNDFAVNAAIAVSRNPGTLSSYNPLLIYGGVGLGKTHLIQAIGNHVNNFSDHKVVYITAETFTNEFIESIKNQTTNAFKRKYRSADLLLIDDIHFFQKKMSCQEELFNTFNALYAAKKQMVFTCDRPIIELKHFIDRLASRLGQGMQLDIQIPQYETRYAILLKKIETFSVTIPKEVIELICKNISTNVRDMISALHKLVGYIELTKKEVTINTAQTLLKDIFTSPKQTNVSIEIIIKVVATHFNISINDIKSKKRTKAIVHPRHLAMYIARCITDMSFTDIGQAFNGKDHTTVMHAEKTINELKHSDPSMDGLIRDLIKTIKEQSVN
jgi:chromosomal replication initiator protein